MDGSADTLRFDEMRAAMVASQLRTTAVDDSRVIKVMGEVPRERFVPAAALPIAYYDRDIALGNGRAMNAPLASARLINEAEIASTDRVLLIGAATGYTAAVLAELAGSLVALEEDATLAAQAREALAGMANVTVVEGPLVEGWAQGAPYDAIVIDGAVEFVPDAIVHQAKIDGRVTTGVIDRGVSRLAAGRRSEGGFGLVDFADVDCVVLPGFSKPPTFQF
ncbi:MULTISPECIES: protein-L-isoaspartate O-methyltransferase family protein [Sphingomonas]|uniref:Protein-L-isoaspartate O-methyltransferase n=1 Tax=Sphingomonas molluscorum TaxID=418184 RepID=A0ABU8Q6W7_9SPHN|nr:protein-L-isoaspartate O-methyltransferase [Sphingomonas sp. JUb134]MBM7406807.1 protein-L-isoaspartate(D-aspartate) O-methyltransferase [Sphingomonas sp. JUb134]